MATPDVSTSVEDDNQYDLPLHDEGTLDWDVYSKVGSFSFTDLFALSHGEVGADSAMSPHQLPLQNKVFAFEKTGLPVFSMQDPAAKKVSSAKPPPFKTRTPAKDEKVVSSPSETGDGCVDLSNNFEYQFQGPDWLSFLSTPVFPTISKSSEAARTISSGTPPLNMAMEYDEENSPEEETVKSVELPQTLLMPADASALLELPLKPFAFKRASPHKFPAARPLLNANCAPDAVTLEGIVEKEAQKSEPRCKYRLEPNSFKAELEGKLQPAVDKYSIAQVCDEYKGTPRVEVQGGVPYLELKDLKGKTWWGKVNSKKRKREGSEGGHIGKPRKAKKSSLKFRSKRGRDVTDSETTNGRKRSRN